MQFLTWLETRHVVHVSYCCRPAGQSAAHLSWCDTIRLPCKTHRGSKMVLLQNVKDTSGDKLTGADTWQRCVMPLSPDELDCLRR